MSKDERKQLSTDVTRETDMATDVKAGMSSCFILVILGFCTVAMVSPVGVNASSSSVPAMRFTWSLSDEPSQSTMSCEEARHKCIYRAGCSKAMLFYLDVCADESTGRSQTCSPQCKNALIALTSTEEGKLLMHCKCADEFCLESKRRIEVCREDVIKTLHQNVTCSVAQWICVADPECSTAMDYYHRFCRAMFVGKRCSHRCNNSISILMRQEKAAPLRNCVCDGNEDYDCERIRYNMNNLCFNRDVDQTTPAGKGDECKNKDAHHPISNEVDNGDQRGRKNCGNAADIVHSVVVLVWTMALLVYSRHHCPSL